GSSREGLANLLGSSIDRFGSRGSTGAVAADAAAVVPILRASRRVIRVPITLPLRGDARLPNLAGSLRNRALPRRALHHSTCRAPRLARLRLCPRTVPTPSGALRPCLCPPRGAAQILNSRTGSWPAARPSPPLSPALWTAD